MLVTLRTQWDHDGNFKKTNKNMYVPTLQILIQEFRVWVKHVYFSVLPGQFGC